MDHVKFLQRIFYRIGSLHGNFSRGSFSKKHLPPSATYFISSCSRPSGLQWQSTRAPSTVTSVLTRYYSDEVKPMPLKLMDFNMLVWPSIIKTVKNWIYAALIVRPYFDSDFNLENFMKGAKQAAEIASNYLAEGKLDELEGLLTAKCLAEIRSNLSTLNAKQRHELGIKKEDIYFSFPYELGIIFDEKNSSKDSPQKRFVEVTVVHHVLRGHSEMIERGETIPLNIGVLPEYRDKIFILNYRFIRNYTKGVTDNWTLNVINHFKPTEFTD